MRLDDNNKIHIFGARCINVTGSNAREPCAEELASPKSVESGNLGLTKAVIRNSATWNSTTPTFPSIKRFPR